MSGVWGGGVTRPKWLCSSFGKLQAWLLQIEDVFFQRLCVKSRAQNPSGRGKSRKKQHQLNLMWPKLAHSGPPVLSPKSPQVLGSDGAGKLPEKRKPKKWLGEGATGLLDPASETGAKWGCTGAKQGLGGAKDSWLGDFCSLGPKDLLHPPLSTFGDFLFSGNFPGVWFPNSSPFCASFPRK